MNDQIVRGDGYRIVGWLFFLVGVAATAISLFLPTSIDTDDLASATARLNAAIAGLPTPSLPSSVSNMGLMQQQMVVLHAGIGSAIIGAIFLVGGSLLRELTSDRGVASLLPINEEAAEPPAHE